MNNQDSNISTEFWQRKLVALLHDPPDKCFNIGKHEESAIQFLSGAGFPDRADARARMHMTKSADHFASAADRFVFPKGKCSTTYNGEQGSCFLHPLSSTPYRIPGGLEKQADHLHGVLQEAVYGIQSDDWRVKFFLYWRRWLENAVTSDRLNAEHLAFSPGDSRIPDHSIWTHMAVTSAVAGCLEKTGTADEYALKPAFLLFQMGPVQDFIAQARSTRDLWSGSYLLSWLIAHAMKAVTDQIGPDVIIFPSLRGNGIFDSLHREEMYATLWKDTGGKEVTTWERMKADKGAERVPRWLMTPTLPNRFLALVPQSLAETLARKAQNAVFGELHQIGEAVWEWIASEAAKVGRSGLEKWKSRWDAQLAAFPQIGWAVQPWLEREACLAEYAKLPIHQASKDQDGKKAITPLQRLQDMLDLAEKWLPVGDRDQRYYTDASKTLLNNPGALWAAHYALVDAKLAARRNTRDFNAWIDTSPSENGSPKDSLSGREECIGDEAFWNHLTSAPTLKEIFTAPGHRYGAMNLIKRLWCRSDRVPYLRLRLGLNEREFSSALRFDTVPDIAQKNLNGGKYVAILAMDGDEMGRWVSGEKTPEFLSQVSAHARSYLEPILKKHGKEDLRRLLTPSYHLQFSEALANFSTWLAEPIVNQFEGQLIYSGGDDVLAMLPADRAIPCAEALRCVFCGREPAYHFTFPMAVVQQGYVRESAGYPLVVPGSRADVSIGLAIGHCDAPLQMLVKEAQKAEKTAKHTYQRSALAIALYKRSGEIIHWGCKWDNGQNQIALELMALVTEYSSGDHPKISGRFPYALAQLLQPYRLASKPYPPGLAPSITDEHLETILFMEFQHIVAQQGQALGRDSAEWNNFLHLGRRWLQQTQNRLEDFVKLFLVETFIHRQRGENE